MKCHASLKTDVQKKGWGQKEKNKKDHKKK